MKRLLLYHFLDRLVVCLNYQIIKRKLFDRKIIQYNKLDYRGTEKIFQQRNEKFDSNEINEFLRNK